MAIKNSKMMANSALSFVAGLPCDVYLGGSRRMAEKYASVSVNDKTDYDFYCTYSSKIHNLLVEKGFEVSVGDGSDYLDDEAITVLARDNVQIVLRKNAQFYEKVFENIPENLYYALLWKSSPALSKLAPEHVADVFNSLFAVAHAFEKK